MAERVKAKYSLVAAIIATSVAIGNAPLLLHREVAVIVEGSPYVQSHDLNSTVYNVVLFVSLLFVSTIAVYFVVRRKRLMRLFMYAVWFLIATGVTQFFAVLYYQTGALPAEVALALVYGSFAIGALVSWILKRGRGDLIIGLYSALAGDVFAWILPRQTLVALLVVLPIYDTIMVYKGLLGKIVSHGRRRASSSREENILTGLMVRVGGLSVGTGDFVIYSMASSLVFTRYLEYGLFAALFGLFLSIISIYVGLVLTVELLIKRYGYAPALPIPICLMSPLILSALF